jgi:hypothetical protein
LQNGGGISAGNYFSTDKFVDRVHVSVDRPILLGPQWTDGNVDSGGARARWRAHRSSASDRSGVPKLAGGGTKGREEHGELGSGLTGTRAALWRPGDGGVESGGGGARRGHCSGVERGKKKQGKVWCYLGVVLTFYRAEGAPGRKCQWVTAGDLWPTPLMAGEGVNGNSRGGIKAGEQGALIGVTMMEAGRRRAINCGKARGRRASGRPT